MSVFEIVGGSLMILVCAAILLIVTIQESRKGGGMGALTGSDSYYNKNQGRTLDAVLSKATKYLTAAFLIITIIVYVLTVYTK